MDFVTVLAMTALKSVVLLLYVGCWNTIGGQEIRLVNGLLPWEGRLEVNKSGSWGTVCDTNFDWVDANVVCTSLGFHGDSPSVRRNAAYGQGKGAVLMQDVSCNGAERSISQCRHNNKTSCSHKDDVGVNCLPEAPSPPVRLVDGVQAWEGRLEVWHNSTWHSVCVNGFDYNAARVVCSMLRYNRPTLTYHGNAYYGKSISMIWKLKCNGTETNIFQCSQSRLYGMNCLQRQYVRINCDRDSPHVPARLVSGLYPWMGRVEVWHGGSWMQVCSQNFGLGDARVVCQMLGFLRAQPSVYTVTNEDPVTRSLRIGSFGCHGKERSLSLCSLGGAVNSTCDYPDWSVVNCFHHAPNPPVRLYSTSGKLDGRLEIWYNGSWESVCLDNFNVKDSQRICGILGHTGGTLSSDENETISLEDIKCKDTEENLIFCRHTHLGIHNCSNDTYVYINCNSFTKDSLSSVIYYVGAGAAGVVLLMLLIIVFVIKRRRIQGQTMNGNGEQFNEMSVLSISGSEVRLPVFPSEVADLHVTNATRKNVYTEDPVTCTTARVPVFPSEVADLYVTNEPDENVCMEDLNTDIYQNEVFRKF